MSSFRHWGQPLVRDTRSQEDYAVLPKHSPLDTTTKLTLASNKETTSKYVVGGFVSFTIFGDWIWSTARWFTFSRRGLLSQTKPPQGTHSTEINKHCAKQHESDSITHVHHHNVSVGPS